QQLTRPLKEGRKYILTGYVARSEIHRSTSRLTDTITNYNTPAILRIAGNQGEFRELAQPLGQTPPVQNTDWQYFEITLEPNSDFIFLVLEAYYDETIKDAYNGNILLDGLELVEL
ncbi:MAG: OmpA family protein, partial [Bacteroidota bacterium]